MTRVRVRTARVCIECGAEFVSATQSRCSPCRTVERECDQCGRVFRGHNRKCMTCRSVKRTCPACGRDYRGATLLCPSCRPAHTCERCGRTGRHTGRICTTCLIAEMMPEQRSAYWRRAHNMRRARQLAALGPGERPPTRADYAAVITSGPCVYCGAVASQADHVRPLMRDGRESLDNLVPACTRCNRSKKHLLLIEWIPERVEHAAACSPIVAAELARQLAEIERAS
jgi:HNH endonuclease